MPFFSRAVRNFAIAAVCVGAMPFQTAFAGPLGDFNVMTFDDFTASYSDVEGRLYAGGNVSVTGYTLGLQLPSPGGNTLVVGGDLQYTGGEVHNGGVKVGGTATTSGMTVHSGTVTDGLGLGGVPVDFASEQNRLTGMSTSLSGLAANGSTQIQYSSLVLTGDGSASSQVFSVDASQISSVTEIKIENVASGTDVIINVAGTSVQVMNGGFQGFSNNLDHILFNFYEAETLGFASVQGSILAPLADITASYGQINGQIVGNSWTGGAQVNLVTFEGTFTNPVDDVVVPEPGMAGLLGMSLVGLGLLRRRKAA